MVLDERVELTTDLWIQVEERLRHATLTLKRPTEQLELLLDYRHALASDTSGPNLQEAREAVVRGDVSDFEPVVQRRPGRPPSHVAAVMHLDG